jgi:hypothetical protein
MKPSIGYVGVGLMGLPMVRAFVHLHDRGRIELGVSALHEHVIESERAFTSVFDTLWRASKGDGPGAARAGLSSLRLAACAARTSG